MHSPHKNKSTLITLPIFIMHLSKIPLIKHVRYLRAKKHPSDKNNP